jgi:hypothetical protein
LLRKLLMAHYPITSLHLTIELQYRWRIRDSGFTVRQALPHAKTVYVTVLNRPQRVSSVAEVPLAPVVANDDVQQTLAANLGGGCVEVMFV